MRVLLARLLFWRRKDARLREFAETEAFGARDLARAAEMTRDPWLRNQLLRHAQDEVRHAALLAEGTAAPDPRPLGASLAGETVSAEPADVEAMGELPFLTFVHLAEKRATEEFALHRDALGADGERFDSILADERRHVAWTGHALERFRAGGRGGEVDREMRRFQRGRILGTWLWIARKFGVVMSTIVLTAVYFLVLAPFALVRRRFPSGWHPSPPLHLDREF